MDALGTYDARSAAGGVREGASGTIDHARDRVSTTAANSREQAGNAIGAARGRAGNTAGSVKNSVTNVKDGAAAVDAEGHVQGHAHSGAEHRASPSANAHPAN